MSLDLLREEIRSLCEAAEPDAGAARAAVDRLLTALEAGDRSSGRAVESGWVVHGWVKQGILLGFRVGRNVHVDAGAVFHFRDRDTFPAWDPRNAEGRDVRLVPGGTTVRRGAHLGDGVVVMPPAYVNVGAWVGPGSMIDSHALVGSCAQVGREVHVSAAAQIGGVLEPIGALPVVVEDEAFIGGNCGVYEGVRVGRRAVLAPGVVLTGAVALYDLARETVHRSQGGEPLVVPEGAVVVPGTRPASGDFARRNGLQLHAPVIVKYRDASTDASLSLEEALR